MGELPCSMISNEPSRWLKFMAYSLVALGFVIVLLAASWTIVASIGFYLSALKLGHGTGVRPMGLTLLYFFCAAASFVLGIPLAVVGGKMCEKGEYANGAKLAKTSVLLGCLPLPLGMALMWIAASVAGVVMEP